MVKRIDFEIAILDTDPDSVNKWTRKLNNLGFFTIRSFSDKQELFRYLTFNKIDLLFIDYYLGPHNTALNLVLSHEKRLNCPVIFTLSIEELKDFDDVMACYPYDVLSITSSEFDIYKSIMFSTDNWIAKDESLNLNDYILVKKNDQYHRIDLKSIEYVEVNGKYLILQAGEHKYIVRDSLTNFQKKLPSSFIKIHQSFIINRAYIVSLNTDFSYVVINDNKIPVSRTYRKHLRTNNLFR